MKKAIILKKFITIFPIVIIIVSAVAGYFYYRPTKHKTSNQNIITQSKTSAPAVSVQKNCAPGFIKVPGSSLYNTPDFCVMKYDAKCASTADPTTGLAPRFGTTGSGESNGHAYGTYKNNGAGAACTVDNNKEIVSSKSGFPIAYIPESDSTSSNAEAYCKTNGWHLINNNEWMTIARNVEQVPLNWCDQNGTNCGFPPGTINKILANGHNDSSNEVSAGGSSTDSALIAGDDNQPCFGTTTDGSNKCGGKSSQKRTLALSNNEIIWDFAGNVWQWVDNTVMRKDQPKSMTNGVLDLGWTRSDFAPGSLASVLSDNGQGNALGYNVFRPSNPSWNANNGVGRIYHYSSVTDTDTTFYTFIRGGNWKHGYDDGAFTVHMSPVPDKTNINDIGFRCVAVPQ